jgi:hypothetical protein
MRGLQERISRIECDRSLLAVFAKSAHCSHKRYAVLVSHIINSSTDSHLEIKEAVVNAV